VSSDPTSAYGHDELARCFADIALDAGQAIMGVYARPVTATLKSDRTPVTEADTQAEAIILKRLADLLPGVPVLSEEAASCGEYPDISGATFLAVDPLDGTKEFISRNGEFTVNIALIDSGMPLAGVVFAPALSLLFGASRHAWWCVVPPAATKLDDAVLEPIRTRPYPADGLTAMVSRSHLDAKTINFLAKLPIAERHDAGSSLKFCRIAAGEADVYPRFNPTMEWDTAAGHSVLLAAGGCVLTLGGLPLSYGKKQAGFKNPGFIAWGKQPHPLDHEVKPRPQSETGTPR
jgi:3'(2'),5'-bisphosphate nucleotidase